MKAILGILLTTAEKPIEATKEHLAPFLRGNSLNDFNAEMKSEVSSLIKKYVSEAADAMHLESEKEEYSKVLNDYISRPSHYSRPLLVMLTSGLYGNEGASALKLASAVQLSEEWMLVLDDIQDKAEMRRGKKTLHKLYGNQIAELASATLESAMHSIISDYIIEEPDKAKAKRVCDAFRHMGYSTAAGQYLDLKFTYNIKDFSKVDTNFYYSMVDGKTSIYTVYGPMVLSALASGKTGETIEMFTTIGKSAGIAFQIADDIMDFEPHAKTGKQQYGDLYEGKLNFVMLNAFKISKAEERKRILEIYAKNRESKTTSDIDYLVSLVEKYDSISHSIIEKDKYAGQAASDLLTYLPLIPKNKYRDWIAASLMKLYNREEP